MYKKQDNIILHCDSKKLIFSNDYDESLSVGIIPKTA